MADTVKTLLLKSLVVALSEILDDEGAALFGRVIRYPFTAQSIENVKYPVLFIFEETENIDRRNRVADCSLNLHLEFWDEIHVTEANIGQISDRLDYLAAQVYIRLINIKIYYPMLSWIKNIEPQETNSVTKFYESDTLAGAVLLYKAIYLHVWRDPYNPGRQ